jgi:hypothetical protein
LSVKEEETRRREEEQRLAKEAEEKKKLEEAAAAESARKAAHLSKVCMKLTKKKGGEIALSFASPEKEKYHYFIYDVITWEKFLKRFSTYYSYPQKLKLCLIICLKVFRV